MLQTTTTTLDTSGVQDVPFPINTYPATINQKNYQDYKGRSKILAVQTKEIEDFIDILIDQANNTSNFLNTPDYKKYGLLPGQQIAYSGGFGLKEVTHHGVYIGDGIVAEVASQSCLRSCLANSLWNLNTLCFGLSTLADFAKRAKNSPILLYKHKGFDDSNPDLILKRLKRTKEIVSSEGQNWRQWVLTHNCQSAANYVSYGKFETSQGQISVFTIFIATALNNGLGKVVKGYYDKDTGRDIKSKNPNCEQGTCMDRYITSKGCVCESNPKYSLKHGSYCYVDGKVCGAEDKKDSIGKWGLVTDRKPKKICLRKGKKKKYLKC